MKNRNFFLKSLVFLIIFGISMVGFTFTTSTKKIGGENVNVSLLTLGTKALAYCNEATYSNEMSNGICTGVFNDPTTTCRDHYPGDKNPDCVKF